MTTKNSILLMVKQANGISINGLFNKIAAKYSNPNSARAALSRAIKDLTALGLVHRTGNAVFLTRKGLVEINKEMKNKLLLKLNELILSNEKKDIDEIVAKLSVLLERSKQDADLLKAAKDSSKFYLSDLEKINKELDKQVSHLSYLQGIFSQQINSLKELDFKDRKELTWENDSLKKIALLVEKKKPKQLVIECAPEFIPMILHSVGGERKKDHLFLEQAKTMQLLEFLKMEMEKPHELPLTVSVIFLDISMLFEKNRIIVEGAYSTLSKLFTD